MPLHFSSRSDALRREEEEKAYIKQEEGGIDGATGIQPLVAEADDEDEEENVSAWRDSGIGTSLEEGDRRGVQRRRKALFGGRSG